MTVRQFHALVLAMPRDTVFWRLLEKEPEQVVDGEAARDLLRNL